MKLRCQCGELMTVDLPETAATVTCSSCGQVYQLQRRSNGKLGARPLDQAPPEPEEPEGSMEDWPDGFELETPGGQGTDEAPPPATGTPESLDEDVGFELEAPPSESAEVQAPARGRPAQQAPQPPPTPVIEEAEEEPRSWKESFFGGFVYAYAAVFAGDGWKAWLRFAGLGIGIALGISLFMALASVVELAGVADWIVLAIFFMVVWATTEVKFLLPTLFLVILPAVFLGAPLISFFTVCAVTAGTMYHYLTHGASSASTPLKEARPRFGDDMIVPFVLIIGASIVLVVVPVIIGGIASHFTGGLSLSELQRAAGAEGPSATQVGSALAQSAILIGTALFGFFCFPMVVMLLVASDAILASLNPVTVFATIFKAPLEYMVVWLFILFNGVVAVIGLLVLLLATAVLSTLSGLLGTLIGTPLIILFLTFLSAAVGWRAGLFMNRNVEAFEHVAQ